MFYMQKPQSYENHTRWHPVYHFVLLPLILINLIYSVAFLVRNPNIDRAEYVLLAVALVLLTFVARAYPLRVQDRLIRLEERLRMRDVLSAETAEKAMDLRVSQYIALRFASDEELDGLVNRIADGELTDAGDIKKAIKEWRADYFRV